MPLAVHLVAAIDVALTKDDSDALQPQRLATLAQGKPRRTWERQCKKATLIKRRLLPLRLQPFTASATGLNRSS